MMKLMLALFQLALAVLYGIICLRGTYIGVVRPRASIVYIVLPLVSWMCFSVTEILFEIWIAIGFVAWMEFLHLVISPRLPPGFRAIMHID